MRPPAVAVVALALAGAACFGRDLPQVQAERVSGGEVVEHVSAPARVEAAARQTVAARVAGTVAAIEAGDGAHVDAGQAVVRLHSEQVDAALAQADAARAAARAPTGVRVPSNGAATSAAAAQAVAELDASTQPRLADARARASAIADESQRAAAVAAVDAAEAAYQATRAALLGTGAALAQQQDALAAALADVLTQALRQASAPQRAQADAAAAAATAQVDHLVAKAPFAGTIRLGDASLAGPAGVGAGGRADLPAFATGLAAAAGLDGGGSDTAPLRVGAPVAPGQVLFTVYDLSNVYVTADVDEIDAPQVRVGQRAEVLVDAAPDSIFDGVVEAVASEGVATDAGGVGYRARIRLLPPESDPDALAHLRVGMTASADIVTKRVDGETVVPTRALLRRGERDVVSVVRDGVVHAVAVEVLALGEDRAAVRGDLRDDDRVVVAGGEDLPDGTEVDVQRDAAR